MPLAPLYPLSPQKPEQRIGEKAGGWYLERLLGVGGAGAVYEGLNADGKTAAIKVLHLEFSEEEVVRERFAREARIANLVGHPGVVTVLGDGTTADGSLYIVMELLRGETLEARWTRKGQVLSATEVLWIVDEVLDVLTAAHKKGVVHRDIKPENLFLTDDRHIKVLDFGIARVRGAMEMQGPNTRVGDVLGSLDFMSPEQARGEVDRVGVQTDLWGVGATMFALLSGQTVHRGGTVNELLSAATKRAPPSLSTVAPHLPKALVEVVNLALSFDIARRWPSAHAMQLAVREVHGILKRRSLSSLIAAEAEAEPEPFGDSVVALPGKLDSVEPPPLSIVMNSPYAEPADPFAPTLTGSSGRHPVDSAPPSIRVHASPESVRSLASKPPSSRPSSRTLNAASSGKPGDTAFPWMAVVGVALAVVVVVFLLLIRR